MDIGVPGFFVSAPELDVYRCYACGVFHRARDGKCEKYFVVLDHTAYTQRQCEA